MPLRSVYEGGEALPKYPLVGLDVDKKAGSRIEENVEVNSQQNQNFFFESNDNVEQMKKQININLSSSTRWLCPKLSHFDIFSRKLQRRISAAAF